MPSPFTTSQSPDGTPGPLLEELVWLQGLARRLVGDEAAANPELVDHVLDAYLGVRAQGSRAERSRQALTEAFPGLHVWTALRRSPPPERLEALVALGDELFRS